ncbi:galactose-1-phosphate uridylyltransferase [Jeotgalibacillus alimentarius]|uniref:Galactose-1-phosphate uridylyltransferase n=1 Tax=Jeotgalibacillus alimentarius TaxID=135826 RepID=A0A0C2V4S8_9BACL|nr:UDP-glucose--hexose-1-phosphate uridylyltransferase [Jeotgalibacillus alimentarius]KIL43997.1 galactose-1-phosphate uridylyltransferase [Jeotgalibacillus alimentarius]
MTIDLHIERLLQYGLQQHLISPEDQDYARNRVLAVLKKDSTDQPEPPVERAESPTGILNDMLDWAQEHLAVSTVTERDQLDAAIMDCLMPRPSEVNATFRRLYAESPERATAFFYILSKDSNYIRMDRIAKNEHWISQTEYGDLEMTINLSKPEKDPKTIAAEKEAKAVNYPLCLLCKENVGYAGRMNHPARQNHRVIPVELTGEKWGFQYSPYVYYNEHAIIFSNEHSPMKVSKEGFNRLLDFVRQYPHYFVGSNADLPIVGGSILSHDHFQGGRHTFAMAEASPLYSFEFVKGVQAEVVKWPMSVIRLRSKDERLLADAADCVLQNWISYADEQADILPETNGERHNTVTPIARMRRGQYEMDLVLRNNRTTEEHPLGLFHPHEEVHAIKKENIGLIEVMGLAVLPGRLKEELQLIKDYLVSQNTEGLKADERTAKHAEWVMAFAEKESITSENADRLLKQEVGRIFSIVLSHAGVFKQDEQGIEAFRAFTSQLTERVQTDERRRV